MDKYVKDPGCCLYPCPTTECPLEVCAKEFPGGMGAYIRCTATKELSNTGMNVVMMAEKLSLDTTTIRRRLRKVRK